jgi:hypothetical protein
MPRRQAIVISKHKEKETKMTTTPDEATVEATEVETTEVEATETTPTPELHDFRINLGQTPRDAKIFIDEKPVNFVHCVNLMASVDGYVQIVEVVFADLFKEDLSNPRMKELADDLQHKLDILKDIPGLKISFVPIAKDENNVPLMVPEPLVETKTKKPAKTKAEKNKTKKTKQIIKTPKPKLPKPAKTMKPSVPKVKIQKSHQSVKK